MRRPRAAHGVQKPYVPPAKLTPQTDALAKAKLLKQKRATKKRRQQRRDTGACPKARGKRDPYNKTAPEVRHAISSLLDGGQVTLEELTKPKMGYRRRTLLRWLKAYREAKGSESISSVFRVSGAPRTLDPRAIQELEKWVADLVQSQLAENQIPSGASKEQWNKMVFEKHLDTVNRRTGNARAFVRADHPALDQVTLDGLAKTHHRLRTGQHTSSTRMTSLFDERALASQMIMLDVAIKDPKNPERNKHPTLVVNGDVVSVLCGRDHDKVRIVPFDYHGRVQADLDSELEFALALYLAWGTRGNLMTNVSFLGDRTMPDGFILKVPLRGWGNTADFPGEFWIMSSSHPTVQCIKDLARGVLLPGFANIMKHLPPRDTRKQEYALYMCDGQWEQCEAFTDKDLQRELEEAHVEVFKHHKSLRY